LHGSPIVWFIGQVVRYIMRPSDEMTKYINERKSEFNFKHPIVGIHVRRTDKVGTEAAFHPLSEYMQYVEDYYNRLDLFNQRNQKVCTRDIWVYLIFVNECFSMLEP
jgi:glycoprotein 6-alpha-L-fucosyltransferase